MIRGDVSMAGKVSSLFLAVCVNRALYASFIYGRVLFQLLQYCTCYDTDLGHLHRFWGFNIKLIARSLFFIQHQEKSCPLFATLKQSDIPITRSAHLINQASATISAFAPSQFPLILLPQPRKVRPMFSLLKAFQAHHFADSRDTDHPINMSDSKQAARDETNYRLGVSSKDSEILQNAGSGSAKKRGKSHTLSEVKFPSPNEERTMENAGRESADKRKYATEQIAKHYRDSSWGFEWVDF